MTLTSLLNYDMTHGFKLFTIEQSRYNIPRENVKLSSTYYLYDRVYFSAFQRLQRGISRNCLLGFIDLAWL